MTEAVVHLEAGTTEPTARAVLRICFCAAVCVFIAEAIGLVNIPLGGNLKVTLFPFIWALLLGTAWGVVSPHLPAVLQISKPLQALSAVMLQPVLLLFISKLGLLVGGSLPKILGSGWALVLQEFGHFFGTMFFGLPLALLLGIKREAIGATFSIGREPSLAIIAERYGMASPEGHGVLAEYLTGTVVGAIFIGLLASFVTSLKIFDPLALAMGAGVGSGSVMAAASAAIGSQQTPDVAKEVAAFAAASNLVTTTIGTYFTLLLSLPFTIWAYNTLEPVIGRTSRKSPTTSSDAIPFDRGDATLSPLHIGLAWVLTAVIAMVGNYIAFRTVPTVQVIEGMAIILLPVLAGNLLYVGLQRKVPAVLLVSLLAMALTFPSMPFASTLASLTGSINFLALATPIIAFAGLSIARDIPMFRRLGWRIVAVSLVANAGTFLGATFIAHFFVGRGH